VNFRSRPQLSDPKHELVLEAVVNGNADALVTHNVRDFEPAIRVFGVRVLLALRWQKQPAGNRRELERGEEVAGDVVRHHAVGLIIRAESVHADLIAGDVHEL
jgi:hypothetical protein